MARPKGSKNKVKSDAAPKSAAKKRGRPAKAKAAATEPVPSSPSSDADYKRPNKEQVTRMAKRIDSFATDAGNLSDMKKETLAKAVETQHFNRTALMQALAWRRRAKKDPVKFSLEFAHFLSYIDDLELDKIANENRGFDLEDGEDDGQTDLEEAIDAAPAQSGLRIVPGPAAPTEEGFEIPPAPASDEEAA